MKAKLIIYWSRRDFRLYDNKALHLALEESLKTQTFFLPLFILEDYMCEGESTFQFGYPSQYFLSHALPAFSSKFSQFALVRGTVIQTFKNFQKDFDIKIFVNEDVHPDFYSQIEKMKKHGIEISVEQDALTINRNIKSGQGNYYSVFTPFKNAVWQSFVDEPLSPLSKTDKKVELPEHVLKLIEKRIPVNEASILSCFKHSRKIKVGKKEIDLDTYTQKPDLTIWYISEEQALDLFKQYLSSQNMNRYKDNRDSLELDATSKMSVALAWGLVSARTLVKLIQKHGMSFGAEHYISELIWREFYKYLLYHNPKLINTEFQEKFRNITWVEDKTALARFISWIKGETGYPIVDAAMNQLAKTGWMHNRSRMIVASILTKNLGVDWRWGQEYFRATLIDLDEASNNGGWQWAASVGADPKPIRIFNAALQADNHDKNGVYQRKWLGEKYLENPPKPIVEHKTGREEALVRYGLAKNVFRDF